MFTSRYRLGLTYSGAHYEGQVEKIFKGNIRAVHKNIRSVKRCLNPRPDTEIVYNECELHFILTLV